jgi:catechol 2,3-dioxygenase-like lactoylglutathione lyase family enzyme
MMGGKQYMKRGTFRTVGAGLVAAILTLGGTATAQNGIPTSLGVDHIAVTVPNLKQAIDFYTKVLGCEYIYTAGPFSDPKGDWMKTNLAVDPGAVTTLAMVRCGKTQNVELFEYTARDQVKTPPRNSDIGGAHLCFYVTDIQKAVAYLKSIPGVTVLGDPTPVSGQPNGGEQFVYFSTPWGQMMEVVTYNNGLEYEKNSRQRLFSVR